MMNQGPQDAAPVKRMQLPAPRRLYLTGSDLKDATEAGLVTYEGTLGGTYVDRNAHWHQSHKKENPSQTITYNGNKIANMHPVPKHGPNLVEFTNGERGLENDRPVGEDGKKLSIAKDDKGGHKIIKKNMATTLNGEKGIPNDATDVFVAGNPTQGVQATFKYATGLPGIIYTKEAKAAVDDQRWDSHREATPHLRKAINALNRMDVSEMKDSEKVLNLIAIMGFRHGQAGEARIHEDGNPTGVGCLTFLRNNIEVDGNKTTFKFRAKKDIPLEFSTRNSRVSAIVNSLDLDNKEPTDRLFNTTTETNNSLLKKLAGHDTGVHVMALRRLKAGDIATSEIKKRGLSESGPLSKKEYSKLRKEVSMSVGKKLGHRRSKRFKGGTTKKGVYEDEGSTSLKNYIDPNKWKHLTPSDVPLQKNQGAYPQPDWHGKGPNEERDIDEWAEDRRRKGENKQWGIKGLAGRPPKGVNKRILKAPKTWIEAIMEQGFVAPLIKQVTPDGRQIWFLENGTDYIANFGLGGNAFIEKAVFKPTLRNPSISYAPSQSNRKPRKNDEEPNVQGEPYTGDVIDDDEAQGL